MAAVDVDGESILASVFKDSTSENWRNREPQRLAEERDQIPLQTQELVFNYKTFIPTADCTQEIYTGNVKSSISRLLDKLSSFGEECMKEEEEILGIPQLMDTCIRNSYYEDALELAAYVKRLEKKHSSLPVIQGIVQEVRQSAQLMLNQLLQQLSSNCQLTVCPSVIGYLRRMDVFTEAELRVKFLQARGSWLHSILTGIPSDDPYSHITKTIEACRVHLFDIITQYHAIFSDEDLLMPPAGQMINKSAILYGWVVQMVAEFLRTLERNLHHGVGGRLDSLLDQCMYFGLSLSRVGVDFRGQLPPIFQRVAADTFHKAVQEAVSMFQEDMNKYIPISLPSTLSGTVPLVEPSTQPGTLQPPMALLDFPPLAGFLNNCLTAFNDLRLCCPIGLAQEVTKYLEDALKMVTKLILVFHRAEESAFSSKEKELFVQFCSAFAEDLVPFLNRCLQVLFPPAQLALILGIPPTHLHKYGNLGRVDVDTVLEPLEFVLPKHEVVAPEVEIGPELSSLTIPEPVLSDILNAAEEPQPKEPFMDSTNSLPPESAQSFSDPELDAIQY